MPATQYHALAALQQPVSSILSHGFRQPVAPFPTIVLLVDDERLLHETRQQVEDLRRGDAAHGDTCFMGPTILIARLNPPSVLNGQPRLTFGSVRPSAES